MSEKHSHTNKMTDLVVWVVNLSLILRLATGTACGGNISDTSGQITSPDLDGDGAYDHSSRCNWTIMANDNARLITLTVQFVDIFWTKDCIFDFLQISDSNGIIGKYCGEAEPGIFQGLNVLYLVFVSENVNLGWRGFAATFTRGKEWTEGARKWPDGDYSLPMSIYGCPDADDNVWEHGYINISFVNMIHITEQYTLPAGLTNQMKLLGPYGPYSLQMNFCTKLSNYSSEHNASWPRGQFLIYGSASGCPEGLTSEYRSLRLPNIAHVNKDGYLPWMTFHQTEIFSIEFLLCRKASSVENESKTRTPYIVMLDTQEDLRHFDTQASDIILEQLRMVSVDNTATIYTYDWFLYAAVLNQDTELANQILSAANLRQLSSWNLEWPIVPQYVDSWIVYDLGQSIVVSKVSFRPANWEESVDTIDSVLVFLADTQNDFYGNGALSCLPFNQTFFKSKEILCLNSVTKDSRTPFSGRYLKLFARSYIIANIIYKRWIVTVSTERESYRCSRYLGPKYGLMGDFQISASSEHPEYPVLNLVQGKTGWCAEVGDTSPLLQIDLLRTTVIEGVKIINWQNAAFTNYSFQSVSMGVQSFTLSFIESDDGPSEFTVKQTFHLDMHLFVEDGQYFRLASTLTTRYIQFQNLSKLDPAGLTCLRIELFGCPILGSRSSFRCAEEESATWYPTKQVYIPQLTTVPESADSVGSQEDCITRCEHTSESCYLVAFHTMAQLCLWYEARDTSTYENKTMPDNILGIEAFVKVCEPVESSVRKPSLYLLGASGWETVTTVLSTPSVFISPGYPSFIQPGMVWRWKITSDRHRGHYVGLFIADISFRSFEASSTSNVDVVYIPTPPPWLFPYGDPGGQFFENTSGEPADRLDQLFVMSEQFDHHWGSLYTGPSNISLDDQIRNQYILKLFDTYYEYPWTNYRSEQRSVWLLFQTSPSLPTGGHGKGFKAIVYSYAVPTCPNFCDDPTECSPGCGIILSETWYGPYPENNIGIWTIPIIFDIKVYFKEFDIGCFGYTTFVIYDDTNNPYNEGGLLRYSYCNTNIPLGEMTFVKSPENSKVHLEFKLKLLTGSLADGFVASWYAVFPNDNSVHVVTGPFGGEVCWYEHDKCYYIFKLPTDLIGYCGRFNLSDASLHSKEEQDFLIQAVKKIDEYVAGVYLGLTRQLHKEGYYKYRWTDGSPVTFMSWDVGQPSVKEAYDCTRLKITPTGDGVWEEMPCLSGNSLVSYTVCQNVTNIFPKQGDPYNGTATIFDNVEMKGYFLCLSGEIISFLGRCNGYSECSDSSDEKHCKNATDQCSSKEFQCGDGTCISISVVCDHQLDCPDGSDENCYFPAGCALDEFQCDNSECISKRKRCDGLKNCLDGSDENSCIASNCNSGAGFMCGFSKCIPSSRHCDGVTDCPYGDDESDCDFPKSCAEWWHAGYHSSGIYNIHGVDMECMFEDTAGHVSITTKYSHIDYSRTLEQNKYEHNFQVFYGNTAAVSDLSKSETSCQEGVEFQCQPRWQFLYEYDMNSTGQSPLSSLCRCERYSRITYFSNQNEPGSPNSPTKETVHQETNTQFPAMSDLNYNGDNYDLYDAGAAAEWWPETSSSHSDQRMDHSFGQPPYMEPTPGYGGNPGEGRSPPGFDKMSTPTVEPGFTDSGVTFYRQIFRDEDCKSGSVIQFGNLRYDLAFDQEFPSQFFHIYTKGDGVQPLDPETIKIKLNPIKCSFDNVAAESDIACGNGYSTPREMKCLYNISEFGNVIGCSSLAHLQNCAQHLCPRGYFKCPESFCLDSRFVCDGEIHCEHGEDEISCETRVCVSQYKCLKSNICLNNYSLCDGVKDCPLGDDERLCHFRCVEGCTCQGLTMDCSHGTNTYNTSITINSNARFLDVSKNPSFLHLIYHENQTLTYLSYLNVSHSDMLELRSGFLKTMKNLLLLDASYNRIKMIQSNTFAEQNKLTKLILQGNLEIMVIEQRAFAGLNSMNEFVMSDVRIESLAEYAFDSLELGTVDLSSNIIYNIKNNAFGNLKASVLYLNSSLITSFDVGIFSGLENVKAIVTNAYKYCCVRPSELPEENCYPHKDEFSSCSDLMRNEVLRSLIWILGLFALIGNVGAFVYRVTFDRKRLKLGYGIFVTNLAVSDFMMGLYMIIIASADAYYRGVYIYYDETWKTGILCQFAGVLAALSSESAVLFISLITIDRILVIKFPFGDFKFSQKLANKVSLCMWLVALFIAIFPLTYTSYFKGLFYSKSGVCLALPLTRDKPPGWAYSISIFIGFNFITFVLIAVGQWLIYWEIQAQKKKITRARTDRSSDLRISRNLLLVVATDFLCWFPIGILGLLALTDHVIPGEVYAWTAVFVLPINSALNPFLYTISAIVNKKKFAPDVSEQTRTQIYDKGDVEKIIDACKSKMFFFFDEPKNYNRIDAVICDKTTTRQQHIKILYGVLKCLNTLHSRGLVQMSFKESDIFVRIYQRTGAKVAIRCRPKLSTRSSEKTDNMEVFRHQLEKVLQICTVHAETMPN